MRLEEDLARWEEGVMPLERVAALHPDEDVVGLLRVHERLSAMTDEPVPDAAPTWLEIESRLDGVATPRRWRRVRPALLAAAAVLLVGAVAFAASAPVREAVRDVWSALDDLVTGEPTESPTLPGLGTPVQRTDVEEVRADLPFAFFSGAGDGTATNGDGRRRVGGAEADGSGGRAGVDPSEVDEDEDAGDGEGDRDGDGRVGEGDDLGGGEGDGDDADDLGGEEFDEPDGDDADDIAPVDPGDDDDTDAGEGDDLLTEDRDDAASDAGDDDRDD